MPANLPPQYYELEREFKDEREPREKLRLAQELLSIMPKHKGTDKLQADLKSKIAKLKKQLEGDAKSHGARQVTAHDYIPREGAGQIILIGAPNSGKSSLVDLLTHAKPLIGDYPYTTREPLTGMMDYETIQIQLIDTPPISHESFEGYLTGLIRNADAVMLMVDLESKTMIDDARSITDQLEEKRIILQPELNPTKDDPRYSYKRTFICAHKEYEDESGEKQKRIAEAFEDFKIVATSIIDDASIARLRKTLFEILSIVRVYTKPVGKDVELVDPVILPAGGTVEDAAAALHKDFAAKLKFARIWGEGKFDGQRVQRDFHVHDGDILEFHT